MTEKSRFHEDFGSRDEVVGPSDRAFGLVFTAVFTILAVTAAYQGAFLWMSGLSAAALLLLAFTLVRPKILAPANRLWLRFGLLLHHIVNPVVMGLIFFVTVLPIGLIARTVGHDPLRRRFDAKVESYWIERTPAGPAPESLKNQF